jgi:ATP-dependent phosphoenolpyruvate carboxykinase
MKELKEKRLSDNSQKNMTDKAKIKYKMDDEILNLYYDLKKYVDRPILNPLDAYNNKEQYIPIIKELCTVFKGDNPYSKYYNMLLTSIF